MKHRFAAAFAVPFCLGLLYWVVVLITAPAMADGLRWLQNNPAITVMHLIFIPAVAGVLAAGIPRQHLRELLTRHRLVSVPLLVILVAIGGNRVADDSTEALRERVIEPLELRPDALRASFLEEEVRLRREVKAGGQPLTASDRYLAFTREKLGPSPTLWRHGSLVAWWQRLLSTVGAVIAIFILWYLLVIGLTRSFPPAAALDAVMLSLALLAVWFPLRLYSEWYVNFGSLDRVTSNQTLMVLAIVFAVVLAMSLTLRSTKVGVKALAGGITGVCAVLAGVAKFNQEGFGRGAGVVEGLSPTTFVSLEIVLLLVLLALLNAKPIGVARRGAPDSEPRRPKTPVRRRIRDRG